MHASHPTPPQIAMPVSLAQEQQNVPLPAPAVASDDDVSDEDLEFVSQLGAPGLAFLASLDRDTLDRLPTKPANTPLEVSTDV